MHFIDEDYVLDYYIALLYQGKIPFLAGRSSLIAQLKVDIVGLKKHDDMHQRIETAKRVWKCLFNSALSSISTDKGGYDSLFKYFDAFVVFEELIFASDSFYRDHTLHCLWVYFLGEYLSHEPTFAPVFSRKTNFLNLIDEVLDIFKREGFPENSYRGMEELKAQMPDVYVLRCLTALTHDLGYPLKKIKKINQSIQSVLPFFGLDKYTEFDFEYSDTHMPLVREMIQFMSFELNFNPASETKSTEELFEILEKYFVMSERGSGMGVQPAVPTFSKEMVEADWYGVEWKSSLQPSKLLNIRYTNDFEKYQHGIMSAYLLFRHLSAFRRISMYQAPDATWNVSKESRRMHNTLMLVFNAIADHTSDSYQIRDISEPSAILSFIDEIEEFSRISRANQNRTFVEEFCKTSLDYIDGCFEINFVFENAELEGLNPEMAFKGRCKRMLRLFNIPKLVPDLHLKLSCIGRLPHNNSTYTIEIKRNFAEIRIDGALQQIPSYLKSSDYYTSEEYTQLK